MKQRTSNVDNFVYIGMVILSFGIVWLIRILISMAIRSAFEPESKK